MTELTLISIKLTDHTIAQGDWCWGPNDQNVACVRMDDGSTLQGEYIPGLFDAKKAKKS